MEMIVVLMECLLMLISLGVYVYFGILIFDTFFSPVFIEQNNRITRSGCFLCMLLSARNCFCLSHLANLELELFICFP